MSGKKSPFLSSALLLLYGLLIFYPLNASVKYFGAVSSEKILLFSQGACLLGGIFSVIASYYVQKRYKNPMLTLGISTALRIGFPAGVLLVFSLKMDNNISNACLMGVVLYYLLLLPLEVRLTVYQEEKKVQEEKSSEKHDVQ